MQYSTTWKWVSGVNCQSNNFRRFKKGCFRVSYSTFKIYFYLINCIKIRFFSTPRKSHSTATQPMKCYKTRHDFDMTK